MEFEYKTEKNEQINLIPMVSVIFLLLIFFLAAGTIRSPAFWDNKPPVSESNERTESKSLQIYMNQQGQIAFEKQTISTNKLISILSKRQNTKFSLQVHADKKVDSSKIIDLINVLDKSLVSQLIVVTTTQAK